MRLEKSLGSRASLSRLLRNRAPQCIGQLTPVAHRDHSSVGSVLGGPSDEVRHHGRHGSSESEEPPEGPKHGCDELPGDLNGSRRATEGRRGGGGDVVEESTDTRESVHRNEKPLLHGEGHGVRTEVMAELVCEDTAQCVMVEFAHRVRRHHHQMSTTGEGVQIVVVDHTDGESVIADVEGLGDFVEGSPQARGLVTGRSASPDEAGQDPPLHHRDEEGEPGQHVEAGGRPVADRPRSEGEGEIDDPPDRHHGQEKYRHDGDQRNEAGQGRPVDMALISPPSISDHAPIVVVGGVSSQDFLESALKFGADSGDTASVRDVKRVTDESTRTSGESEVSSRTLLDLARTLETTDPGRARRLVQRARLVARRDGRLDDEGESLYRLAALAHYDGEPGDAFALAVEADEFADRHRLPLVSAWSLHLIGLIHSDSGNQAEALSHCLRALSLYRSTDHRNDEGNILNTIATIHHESGDSDRAIVNYEAALAANEPIDRHDIDALILANVASLRSERGEHDEAVRVAERALEACRVSAPGFMPDVYTSAARVLARRGTYDDLDRARDLLSGALIALESSPVVFDDVSRSRIESTFGRVEMEAGNTAAAIDHLERALEHATIMDARPQLLEVHTQLAEAYKSAGRFAEAITHLESRFDVFESIHAESTRVRLRTLQVAHEADQARQHSEILRLRLLQRPDREDSPPSV